MALPLRTLSSSCRRRLTAPLIKLIVENPGDETQPAVVRPAKTGEGNAVDTITTPKSGKITFEGLDAIAYQLVETKAPDGYNKLKTPVDVTITRKL